MEEKSHKDCYGAIFPEVMQQGGSSSSGKVFSFAICPSPGTGPIERKIRVNTEQWDDCRSCDEFDDCYKFSMTKLAFELSVSHR